MAMYNEVPEEYRRMSGLYAQQMAFQNDINLYYQQHPGMIPRAYNKYGCLLRGGLFVPYPPAITAQLQALQQQQQQQQLQQQQPQPQPQPRPQQSLLVQAPHITPQNPTHTENDVNVFSAPQQHQQRPEGITNVVGSPAAGAAVPLAATPSGVFPAPPAGTWPLIGQHMPYMMGSYIQAPYNQDARYSSHRQSNRRPQSDTQSSSSQPRYSQSHQHQQYSARQAAPQQQTPVISKQDNTGDLTEQMNKLTVYQPQGSSASAHSPSVDAAGFPSLAESKNKHIPKSEKRRKDQQVQQPAREASSQGVHEPRNSRHNGPRPLSLGSYLVPELGPSNVIRVEHLQPTATEADLRAEFEKFGGIETIKLNSNGLAFVTFEQHESAAQAKTTMDGKEFKGKPITVRFGKPKRIQTPPQSSTAEQATQTAAPSGAPSTATPTTPDAAAAIPPTTTPTTQPATPPAMNTRSQNRSCAVWLGNLNQQTTKEEIEKLVSKYGQVVNTRLLSNKMCAFVNFATEKEAADAVNGLHGATLGGKEIKANFGRASYVASGTPHGYTDNRVNTNYPTAYGRGLMVKHHSQCLNCHCLTEEAVTAPCTHVFCGACAAANNNVCPLCCPAPTKVNSP